MRPLAAELFDTDAEDACLLGGRRADGKIVFPLPQGAERASYQPVPLARDGLLWSWTIQRYRPKSPPYAGEDGEDGFVPYAIGYVELPDQVIVESRLDFGEATPRLGLPMRLAIIPYNHGPDGVPQSTYIFRSFQAP
jgi:uncharacterized OB-fold protein